MSKNLLFFELNILSLWSIVIRILLFIAIVIGYFVIKAYIHRNFRNINWFKKLDKKWVIYYMDDFLFNFLGNNCYCGYN